MEKLTSKEIMFILKMIESTYGFGYSNAEVDGVKVGAFQAKLSILLEVAHREGR